MVVSDAKYVSDDRKDIEVESMSAAAGGVSSPLANDCEVYPSRFALCVGVAIARAWRDKKSSLGIRSCTIFAALMATAKLLPKTSKTEIEREIASRAAGVRTFCG